MPAASSTSPTTRSGSAVGRIRQPVSHQGTRPATRPGARTKKIDAPTAATLLRMTCNILLTTAGNILRMSSVPPPVRAFRTVLLLAQTLRYLMDDRLRADGLTTQQDAAQLVAALQRKGLLRAEPDPADKRRLRLITTAANEDYWRQRDEADFEAVAGWFAVLSHDEVESLCTLASRVLDGLDAHRQAARLRR